MSTARALLIGINYIGTPHPLEGCINDIIEMKGLLFDAYRLDPASIVSLRDDDPANRPTRARILQELQALVASGATHLFLHYSGHGTQVSDTTGQEIDGLEECIVPCDYASAGYITDDQINAIAKGLKGTGLALFDSCRNGTIMDLPSTGISSGTQPHTVEGFYCFSGCHDNQDAVEGPTSTSGYGTGLPQGAMTMAFLSTIRSLNYYPTIAALYSAIKANLIAGGYSQTPQLTSTQPVTATTPFPFSSPTQQLDEQRALNATLLAQIQVLQAQVGQLPMAEAQASLVSTLQGRVEALQKQNDSNIVLIATLQYKVSTLPALQEQAALVPSLQTQLAHLPGLQQQIQMLMSQVDTLKSLRAQVLRAQLARNA
jgi:hypothetical protein